MNLYEAHRNQIWALRDLVLSSGFDVSTEEVEDALSYNNCDEEATYEYLLLLHADNADKDDTHTSTSNSEDKENTVDLTTERDDEIADICQGQTAEEASYEMVASLFKGSKVEMEIESALLNHEFDTEATIMHLLALQEIMEEEEKENQRTDRERKKRRDKGQKLNVWNMGGCAELPSTYWAGKTAPVTTVDHGKGRVHGKDATVISGSGAAMSYSEYEAGLEPSFSSSSAQANSNSHYRSTAEVLSLVRGVNPHLTLSAPHPAPT